MNEVLFGDCRDSMRTLIDDGVRVQCCVTSPPYFGLRDYGHDGQIGLEATPTEYVANLVDVFSLVWKLLADDGVLWVNLGDSYNGYMANQRGTGLETKRQNARKYIEPGAGLRTKGLKNKDLIGIPWRVAFALQDAGWYLRQDIIWHKPSPMPESVRDRCTSSHEYLFLLTKKPLYYWDRDAMQEPATMKPQNRFTDGRGKKDVGYQDHRKAAGMTNPATRNRRSVWTIPTKPFKGAHFAVMPEALVEPCILAGSRTGDAVLDPFMGSGTVAQVAQRLGRQWIGCELNPAYAELQQQRTVQTALAL